MTNLLSYRDAGQPASDMASIIVMLNVFPDWQSHGVDTRASAPFWWARTASRRPFRAPRDYLSVRLSDAAIDVTRARGVMATESAESLFLKPCTAIVLPASMAR